MIRIALNHKSSYHYDRPVQLGPQIVRLRPAPHCRTPINSYSLKITPEKHFINWQQDPHSNFLARLVFEQPTCHFEVEVDLIAEMTVINPFDFFLEDQATQFPFVYDPALLHDLKPFLTAQPAGPKLAHWTASVDLRPRRSVDFLVELIQRLQSEIEYGIRLEPGVQTPEETLTKKHGSCRDSAWLLVQILRQLGLAARFVSGYLIQLKPDIKSLDGPSGTSVDFTDLHAWTEVYLPGAGWVGMDPTSGLFAGEGHLPLACTPEPSSAAPIAGSVTKSEVDFQHSMSIVRVHEDPRVTLPYTTEQWQRIESLGHEIDERLIHDDVRLTMGGEPTFVSIDDLDGAEWTTAAVGPTKRRLAHQLLNRLQQRFAPDGLLHFGQGKWYPGEPLPRWAFTCLWRTDGQPMWTERQWLSHPDQVANFSVDDAQLFLCAVAERLEVNRAHVTLAYEDTLYYLWKEQSLAINADLQHKKLDDAGERARLARLLARGISEPTGCLLPLAFQNWAPHPCWISGTWPVRREHLFLIPGDSPMGLRLPLDSIPEPGENEWQPEAITPFAAVSELPHYGSYRQQTALLHRALATIGTPIHDQSLVSKNGTGPIDRQFPFVQQDSPSSSAADRATWTDAEAFYSEEVIRTALCVEPRNGSLFVFMPPVERLEDYLELLAAIEATAADLKMPVIIEGYLPPTDYRIKQLKVTPDPGVIEVNVQPAEHWDELVQITKGLYADARQSRLGTEKFDVDGTHTGTGGGNHLVLGAKVPEDSPFLRRPDLLRSLIAYWHNHPSLSYLFSSRFIGPTSQAPRVDEGRRDAVYEMQLAMMQIPDPLSGSASEELAPWLVDRIFRHLLVDLTGNTHRAEICIDKLFSPDSSTGRLGLVEFRAFEMPPHWQMSLTQQLLMRGLISRFWRTPYTETLVDWNTTIHDRWLLPHFVHQDFGEVISDLAEVAFPFELAWFEPHFEFRFPVIGCIEREGIKLELRTAIEPWYVLGEESASAGTARYVDSSVERLQIKVSGMNGNRHGVTCNGHRVPLHPTGTEGEFVAGVRYRGWQPPSCLHPTIPVDEPLLFDLLDQWRQRSIGGCRYHVGHPGGLNPSSHPVNAFEAESRRGARFVKWGHTPGKVQLPRFEKNRFFPLTLDLRQMRRRG